MAGLADFAQGFFGHLYEDREKTKAAATEDARWEARQRLAKQLEIDTQKELYTLTQKDGRTYQTPDGKWVTEILDGSGKVISTREASRQEQVLAQKPELEFNKLKFEDERREEMYNLDVQDKRSQINYRNALGAAAGRDGAGAGTVGGSGSGGEAAIVSIVDKYLTSTKGRQVLGAFTQGALSLEQYSDPNSTRTKVSDTDKLAARQQIVNRALGLIKAMPPEKRPKTEQELLQFIDNLVTERNAAIERAAEAAAIRYGGNK